jgi:hypothetical protein
MHRRVKSRSEVNLGMRGVQVAQEREPYRRWAMVTRG